MRAPEAARGAWRAGAARGERGPAGRVPAGTVTATALPGRGGSQRPHQEEEDEAAGGGGPDRIMASGGGGGGGGKIRTRRHHLGAAKPPYARGKQQVRSRVSPVKPFPSYPACPPALPSAAAGGAPEARPLLSVTLPLSAFRAVPRARLRAGVSRWSGPVGREEGRVSRRGYGDCGISGRSPRSGAAGLRGDLASPLSPACPPLGRSKGGRRRRRQLGRGRCAMPLLAFGAGWLPLRDRMLVLSPRCLVKP